VAMNGLVLELISSYEKRLALMEELIANACYVRAASDAGLAELQNERGSLKTSLRELLANNCSLRRKDFDGLLEKILADSERTGEEIEEEQKRVREGLKGYLKEQKRLAAYLRAQLEKLAQGEAEWDGLAAAVAGLKAACQDRGDQVLSMLRSFQLRLEAFRKEEEGINRTLERLVEKGESLVTEDLRQLEAAKARQERTVERRLRQDEVQRLLAHFRRERREGDRR